MLKLPLKQAMLDPIAGIEVLLSKQDSVDLEAYKGLKNEDIMTKKEIREL